MKVSILQENLAAAIATVRPAVAARSTLPILGNIKLEAAGGKFTLSATNLEIGIITHVGAQVHQEGSITLPAKVLADYVNALPPDRIELELNAKTQTVNLKCARYEANIKGIEASEFPIIPIIESKADRAGIEPDVFRNLIARSVFSAAQDDSRPALACVYTEFDKTNVKFASADGFRLTVVCATLARAFAKPLKQLIPARTLHELAKLLKDEEEPCFLAFSDNGSQVIFEMQNTTLVANLIDANFPDYNAIFPKSFATRVVVNAAELQSALKAQTVFARDVSNIVKLSVFAAHENATAHLKITATSAEVGDGETKIDAKVDGDGLEIAFNAKFLNEAVTACLTSQIAFELSTPTAQGVVKPVGVDDFTHVIMPMHVAGMKKPI